MPPAPRTSTTPDYLNLAPWAELVADACGFYADHVEKTAQEVGQQRVMRHPVQLLRRAAGDTQAVADALVKDEPQ